MAKERATKEKPRKREKKISDDKVTKSGKQKRRAATPSGTSDEESEGGASVDVESPEGASIVDSSNLEKAESRADKKTKKEKKPKKENQAEVEADDDTADGGAMLFSIDTNPTPVNLAAVKTEVANESSDGDEEEDGPKKTKAPSGLNRATRRRIKLIERQRDLIKKKMGIPEGSQEGADEVQKELDKWIEATDGRIAVRMEKKIIRKTKEQARLKTKRGKVLTGRALKEREKQIKKAEKKTTKKSGISATNN
ncbi:hypothetical protein E0Z10_g5324 [Xylaria hypoxylon]|uniref:Uncharacterized protein n=1 Tax=Xylaria hypoxylon TaxID=37992 RepID=A0A4Z0YVL5_9PEZI|nr:hypothetical protein E0Z10_g5324 [Xylaria hypoxylon]